METQTVKTVFIGSDEDQDAWMRELRLADPELDLVTVEQINADAMDPQSVRYAITGRIRPKVLSIYPSLRAILSTWAGVEHLLSDPTVPGHIPIVRMVEPSLTQGMVEYVTCHVLNILLRTDQYPKTGWSHPQRVAPRFARDMTVGIMGVGVLGSACARSLVRLGFSVNGWSRTPKAIDDVRIYAGFDQLNDFARNSEIIVLLLPKTTMTVEVLNTRILSLLPRGAAVINVARGELINREALLDALDCGQLSRAILDVFSKEPLDDNHPYRLHPKVTVTPHLASVTDPRTAAPVIVENIRRFERGEPVAPLVDRERGY
ncbi:MAG: glyoxylate/hydroxypyruvate reductase A [marine bacterium B5-7]|nr:MAG: glyoxylate/hydroxypyruvate reductase A [marine bacterium B5-7]